MSLTALLFRGVRFTPTKLGKKPSTCWNCRKRLQPGEPILRGPKGTFSWRYKLHLTCAEAIAADGNEHTREE